MNIKEAYKIAVEKHPIKGEKLSKILDFGSEWGFLFDKDISTTKLGNVFLIVSKDGKKIYGLPTTPNNVAKINSGKKVPLTLIK